MPQSQFARNVVTLMTGTSIAQAIPIAISPILTRLYTPEDFGVFALYMAIASIVAVLVTGRYELAIMLPKKDSDAINIVALSIGLSCIISSILLLIIYVFNSQITNLLGSPAVSSWLYFVPASTLLMGIYQSLNYWSNRKGHYKRMALSRMMQSGSGSLTQLAGGYNAMGASGLVSGQIVGQTLSTVLLGRLIYREDQEDLHKVNRNRISALAKKYSQFPKYLILGQLANVASGQMPLILLSSFFGPAIAGFYALSQRTISAPMALVGGAIGDVFRSEAASTYNKIGNCKVIFLKTVFRLAVFAILPLLPIIFFGPWLFSLIFGEQWRTAGEIAAILSAMVFFQTISSPLSQTVLLAGMQAIDLAWQLLRLLTAGLSFYFGYIFFNDYKVAIITHVASFSILYIFHSSLQYKASLGLSSKS
jgi:O-antigen/teichoic acid export membrane protein